METVKDILKFCNAAIFFDYKNIGIIEKLNQARKDIINIFHQTIPVSRILITLSLRDDVFLKINNNDFGNIVEEFHDLRSIIIYMLSFEKVSREEQSAIHE